MKRLRWLMLLDVLVGLAALLYSIKVFLFAFLCYYIWTSNKIFSRTRSILHVYQVANDISFTLINKKLAITHADSEEVHKDYFGSLTPEYRARLEKDNNVVQSLL